MRLTRNVFWPIVFLMLIVPVTFAAAPAIVPDVPVERIALTFAGKAFKPGDVIQLKKGVGKQHDPSLIKNATLQKVEVRAKSRMGRGQIVLRVGNGYSKPRNVGGDPTRYSDGGADSYDMITIENAAAAARGVWQLYINGYIKVESIVLVVRRNTGGEI